MRLAFSALFLSLTACASYASNVDGEVDRDPAHWHIQCPASTKWNGEECVWRYVISDVRCPQGTVWDGSRCYSTKVTCPEGAAWDGTACRPTGQAPEQCAEAEAATPGAAPTTMPLRSSPGF